MPISEQPGARIIGRDPSIRGGRYSLRRALQVIPDRIEAGLMIAAAIGGDIILENIISEHLTAVTQSSGNRTLVEEPQKGMLRVRSWAPRAVDIKAALPRIFTDLQPSLWLCSPCFLITSVISRRF